jgi:hypothetical protein
MAGTIAADHTVAGSSLGHHSDDEIIGGGGLDDGATDVASNMAESAFGGTSKRVPAAMRHASSGSNGTASTSAHATGGGNIRGKAGHADATAGAAAHASHLAAAQSSEADVLECLRLLIMICDTGRKYKQLVCRYGGVKALLDILSWADDPEMLARAKTAITSLGRLRPPRDADAAHAILPKHSTGEGPREAVHRGLLSLLGRYQNPCSQQAAAQVLRDMHRHCPITVAELHDVLRLHNSLVTEVQYEGDETLMLMARKGEGPDGMAPEALAALIVSELVPLLSPAYSVDVDSIEAMNESARGAAGSATDKLSRGRVVPVPFLKQAAAARVLERIFTT